MVRGVLKGFIVPGFMVWACLQLEPIPASAEVCFRGKPGPDCRAFWVTETGLGYVPSSGGHVQVLSETGVMFNRGQLYALGPTGYIVYDGDHQDFRGGVKFRLRRWLNPTSSVNVSSGVILLSGIYGEDVGFSGHIDLNYKDIVAPYLGLCVLNGGSDSGANFEAGLRFGSTIGLACDAVGAGLVALAVIGRSLAP